MVLSSSLKDKACTRGEQKHREGSQRGRLRARRHRRWLERPRPVALLRAGYLSLSFDDDDFVGEKSSPRLNRERLTI